jgi:hypothetical protein
MANISAEIDYSPMELRLRIESQIVWNDGAVTDGFGER